MNKSITLLVVALLFGVIGGTVLWLAMKDARPVEGGDVAASLTKGDVGSDAPQSFRRERRLKNPAPPQRPALLESSAPTPDRPSAAVPPSPLATSQSEESAGLQIASLPRDSAERLSPPVILSSGPSPENATGTVSFDDALSFALEASDPYVSEGFTIREDYWGGQLAAKQTKAIVHQLFKGNEYWFWMGTDRRKAVISVHVYDADGKLAEAEHWQKPTMAAARVVPKRTGSYYVIVEVERVPTPLGGSREEVTWALAYGFR